MGVRGLTTYVKANEDAFLQQFYLHNCNIVIDGYSMCAQLYRASNCFSAFGGDYDKFAGYIKKYFKNFRKCNVVPYVLFDGCYESRKLKTAFHRLRSKISGASRLDPVTQGRLQIFPLLLRNVFAEVLDDMAIPYTMCEFEADDEIAAMARHLNCPVLSYDSDFFIYNVHYIPFPTLYRNPMVLEENGKRVFALECQIYRVQFLIDNFGGLKEDLLPLLAILLGNDYVEKRIFRKFFSQLKQPKSKKCKNEQQRSINAVFKWLRNESLDSAITKILNRLKKHEKNKVLGIIKSNIALYNSKKCRSLKYFDICHEDTEAETTFEISSNVTDVEQEDSDDERSTSTLSDSEDSSDDNELNVDDDPVSELPIWFADRIRSKDIPSSYFNLYVHHFYLCSPQAEDYNDDDSCLCTLPIIRYAFDILTDFTHDNCVYVAREKDTSYKRIFVGKEYSIGRPVEVPFNELSTEELNSYFYQFITQKMSSSITEDILLLPADFQLYMISILWWVSNCSVPLANIHSLFICYIMLQVIDGKTGTFRGHKHFNNKYSAKIQDIKLNSQPIINDNELFLNKNKVEYDDCLLAANVLLKHFEIDDSIHKRPKRYDTRRMQSFAQFQNCLLQFNSLNCLCRTPLESTKYHKSFNGTFVYNIALKLENQENPIRFFGQYLKGAHSILRFYYSLCKVYESCATKMYLSTVEFIGKKRRRKKKGRNMDEDSSFFLVEGFEANVTL